MLSNVFLLTLPSLIVLFLLWEFVILRFVPITEPIHQRFDEQWSMVTLTPNRSGIYVRGISRKLRYRANSEGWNSLREYSTEKSGATRIAVIGDSYVEAIQVNVEEAFPELIERELSREGYDVEVYRFGISGAPLSQYLHMMRYVYEKFDPDVAIVTLIHNDFDDSLYPVSLRKWGENGTCFLTFQPTPNGEFLAVPPRRLQESFLRKQVIPRSKVLRFLFGQMFLENRLLRLKDRLLNLFGRGRDVEQNVTLDFLQMKDTIAALTRHIFSEFARLSDRYGVKLLLIIDAPREHIYRGEDPRSARVYWFNELSRQLAHETGIKFIDLTDVFLRDYQLHRIRFNPTNDGHWYERGHRLVAQTLSESLLERGWLASPGARDTRSRSPGFRPRPGAPWSPGAFAWRVRP